jgi:hypothetical protein
VFHYEAKPDQENEALTARLVELAHERRRFGYRRLHALVEREGRVGRISMFSVNASMFATCPTPNVPGISASGRAHAHN